MLFREIVTVYCDNNTEHANTLRGQNSESQYVKAGSKGLMIREIDYSKSTQEQDLYRPIVEIPVQPILLPTRAQLYSDVLRDLGGGGVQVQAKSASSQQWSKRGYFTKIARRIDIQTQFSKTKKKT
jgi:hypothetical protein